MESLNLSTLAKHFSDEAAAYELVERMRWPDGPVCPHCGEVGRAYFLRPRNGARLTPTGNVSHRRLWKCAACRRQFSVLVGTIFHDSKVPLSKWLLAVYMMCADKNGVAAFELHRTLGVTHKTAWFMCHRIREAMRSDGLSGLMAGVVVADETFIGGKERNKHAHRRSPTNMRGGAGKTPVVSLIEKHSGEVRSTVVANVSGATLGAVLRSNVDMPNSILHTDEWGGYRRIGRQFAAHEYVTHASGEYVRGDASTNAAEGYFSQLKRSIDGTHHRVSVEHLNRYLAEFDFRYSTRTISDSRRMERLMGQTGGRRLTYQATAG
jgi:transposase-like protein